MRVTSISRTSKSSTASPKNSRRSLDVRRDAHDEDQDEEDEDEDEEEAEVEVDDECVRADNSSSGLAKRCDNIASAEDKRDWRSTGSMCDGEGNALAPLLWLLLPLVAWSATPPSVACSTGAVAAAV
jgi:hypothetical protein